MPGEALAEPGVSRPHPGTVDALALIVNHLVVDGVSWRILTEDLTAALTAALRAAPVVLPAPGTSFREWSQTLTDRADDPDIGAAADFWQHPGDTPGEVTLIPRPLEPATDVASSMARFDIDLPAATLTLPELYRTGPTEILLATLALALARVVGRPGESTLFVDLEGHGRDETLLAAAGADLARTVGWFTDFWPVPVDVSRVHDSSLAAAVDGAIKQVKERLAEPDYGGLEYGMITELSAVAQPRPASPVLLNYLGRLTTGESGGPISALWPGTPLLVVRDDAMPASHPFEVNAVTVPTDTGGRVRVEISYLTTLIPAERAHAVADEWTALLAGLDRPETLAQLGGITPSDSLIDDLTQDEIDEFAGEFA